MKAKLDSARERERALAKEVQFLREKLEQFKKETPEQQIENGDKALVKVIAQNEYENCVNDALVA